MIERTVELPPYRFWERRDGEGTPVVLIHGMGGSADWWRRNFEPLAEQHLVAAVDLVGFGRNRLFLRRSSLPLTFTEIAALLVRWIASSFDGPVHLVGNSMGGHIAMHVAASRPDLVRSLTLVDSTGIPFELKPGLHIEHLVVPRGAISFATILTRDAFRSGPASLAIAFARLLRDDARPLMRALRMPVQLIWGEHDPLVPLTYGEQMAKEIPQARLAVIPNAGHIPMWENAEVFNRTLITFLSAVDRGEFGAPQSSAALFGWGLSGWTNGIAHREAGTRRDIVLVHGLGLSSAYFVRFARALHARGWNPIAPDLPGFGESHNAPAASPEQHAQILAQWADALSIRDAVWVGHSVGCNAVSHLARVRPDLVRRSVMIGPLWSDAPPIAAALRLIAMLVIDAFREPFALYRHVVPDYWRVGVWRWVRTVLRSVPDLRRPEVSSGIHVAGRRDPLPDRRALKIAEVDGAHACHFSHPEETAAVIVGTDSAPASTSSGGHAREDLHL